MPALDNAPILVGVGQHIAKDPDLATAIEPMDMMELAARGAQDDAETKDLLSKVDSVRVVNIFSWRYADPAGLLAERVGASPAEKLYTTLGGNTPQWLVNETAQKVASGEIRLALVAGAEAVLSTTRARREGTTLPWTPLATVRPAMIGDGRPGSAEVEVQHGAAHPIAVYPMFDNALRAAKGRTIQEHQQRLGRLYASLAQVAVDNPYAWFRDGKNAEQIATVSDANRMVGFPYTKYMNAILDVNQGAAIIMTTVGEARRLGIPQSKWVYLLGCADAIDLWFVTERVNYTTSPAIRRAGQRALEAAGLTIDQIDYFDLYSCFPAAVQLGCDMLGIPEDDPRPLTVTGGLPYAGGPGNNYSMHAIATMAERLRAQPQAKGLVTALGWFITKHAVGVYSSTPNESEWRRPDMAADQQELDTMPHPELADQPNGPATIEAYTVMHGRDGQPLSAIIIGRLQDDRRFIANADADRSALESMTKTEMIGAAGSVRHDDAENKNLFAL